MKNGRLRVASWILDPTTLRSGSRNGEGDDYVQSNVPGHNLRVTHLTYTEQNGPGRISAIAQDPGDSP